MMISVLQEGDVIIVPPYEALVSIEGNVKRPMKYEMKNNESVATLLKYAGGFSGMPIPVLPHDSSKRKGGSIRFIRLMILIIPYSR